MGTLHAITGHKKYLPKKVKASMFYGIDPNLDENARGLYFFLLGVCTITKELNYIKWSTTETAIEQIIRSNWGRDLPMYTIKNAFSLLRKNRYLRHVFIRELDARVLELCKFVGENARS